MREEEDTEEVDDGSQLTLFETQEAWRKEWKGMPEYVHEDQTPWQTIYVHFASREDRNGFARLIGQKLSDQTHFVWYPKAEIGHYANVVTYVEDEES